MAENSVEVTVKGLTEALARLQQATFDLQGVAAKRAVAAAARNTARVAQRNASGLKNTKGRQPTGTLSRAIIGHWSPKRSKEYLVHVALVRAKSGKRLRKLKSGSKDAYYAGWVEFGHLNVPRRKGKYSDFALRGVGRATGIAVRRRAATQRNSRVSPYPYLAPAWNATKVGAVRIIEESLRRSLNRAARGR